VRRSNRTAFEVGAAVLVAALLLGCRGRSNEGGEESFGGPNAASSARDAAGAAGSARRPPEKVRRGPQTTSGAIAIANLSAQIAGVEASIKVDPAAADRKAELVDLLLFRAEILGVIGDYERALGLAEELVKAAPEKAIAYLARAQARAALHLFDGAAADLDEATRRGAHASGTRGMRASILAAVGRYDEALALRRAAREARPTLSTLGAEAAVLAAMGRIEEAARLFEEAPKKHRDVSPFPLAQLEFQEGLMWERAGERARARELFEAACERLPAYAHAVSHLAAMEPYARAIELLRPVVERSDNPEYAAQLAELLRRRGEAGEADALLERAKARWGVVTEKFPEAFADHAARFWLGAGGDRPKALELAKRNAALRKTEEALDLMLSAALAAGSEESACEAARAGVKLPYASEVFRSMASSVAAKCPDSGRGSK
jgi:tetratricopeptide (TPR) repeat protein